MIKFVHYSILLCAPLLLASCGFKPMYAKDTAQPTNGITAQTSQIEIAIIADRSGQSLRNHLIDRLYRSGYPTNPIATLKIEPINETKTELDLTKSSDATRAQLRLQTIMNLVDNKGSIVLTRTIQSVTSFNILGSEFATRVTEEAARESALNDLARQVELNLSLYYSAQ